MRSIGAAGTLPAKTGCLPETVEHLTLGFKELENRIKIFVSLPINSLDRLKLQKKLDEIGRVH
jgi:hypothetical protein